MEKEKSNNKKWYKTWWGITLLIFGVLLLIDAIIPDYSELATENSSNINLNKSSSNSTIDNSANSVPVKATSIQNSSEQNSSVQNIPVEKELTIEEIFEQSYTLAVKNNSVSYCENSKLNNNQIQFCKLIYAGLKNDVNVCKGITISWNEYKALASQDLKNTLSRVDTNTFSTRNFCIFSVAYSTKDEKVCNEINSDLAKYGCIAILNDVGFEKYVFGQEIIAGEFRWNIKSYKTDSRIGKSYGSGDYETFMGKTADGIYVILTVEVENIGNSANYLSDDFVKLIDDKGREFSADSGAGFYLGNDQGLSFDTINPGIIKKGKIVFDVPKGINIVAIQISDNLMQSSWYMIKAMT